MRTLLPLCVLGFSLACSGMFEPQTHTSEDGRFQLTTPAPYVSSTELHPQAVLALIQRVPEVYVVIIAEDAADLAGDMSFEARSRDIRDQTIASLEDVEQQEPVALTIDGHPAMQVRFDGTMDGMELGYLHTTILTDQAFVQVVIWGHEDTIEGNEELVELAGSFRQTGSIEAEYLEEVFGKTRAKPYRSTEDTRLRLAGGPWARMPESENPDASLYLEHERLDLALLVISESIEESGIDTLAAFSKTTTERMGPAMEASRYELSDPVPFTAGSLEGRLVTMDADVNGFRFGGLHLSLQGEEQFHQVWAWGPKSQMDRHDAELRAALASFEEL